MIDTVLVLVLLWAPTDTVRAGAQVPDYAWPVSNFELTPDNIGPGQTTLGLAPTPALDFMPTIVPDTVTWRWRSHYMANDDIEVGDFMVRFIHTQLRRR